jgi:hypothetical protein
MLSIYMRIALKSDIEADVARKISKKWLDLEKIIRAIVLILVFIIFRQSLTLFSGICSRLGRLLPKIFQKLSKKFFFIRDSILSEDIYFQ